MNETINKMKQQSTATASNGQCTRMPGCTCAECEYSMQVLSGQATAAIPRMPTTSSVRDKMKATVSSNTQQDIRKSFQANIGGDTTNSSNPVGTVVDSYGERGSKISL